LINEFFSIMSMNKNTKRYGMFGIAAMVAILSVSIVAANFGTQQAIATHDGNESLAAKKGAVAMNDKAISGLAANWLDSPTVLDDPYFGTDSTLATLYLKSNEGGDWVADMSAECAVMTHIEGKGDMDQLEGAYAGAKVSFWLDDKPVSVITGETLPWENGDATPHDAQWNFCSQVFEINTTLNDLIVTCQDVIDADVTDFAGCPVIDNGDGTYTPVDPFKLVFKCDVPQLDDGECAQSVELYLENAGAYNVKVLLKDLESSTHHKLEVKAEYDKGSSSEEGTKKGGSAKVDAAAMIGKRILVAEPIHLVSTQG
jgi:hypothetical protein